MRFKIISTFILIFTIASIAFAQEEVKKESNSDFRNNEELFSVSDKFESKNNIYLMRNNQQEYVLLYGIGEQQGRLRLTSEKMREVDTEFVQRFFQINYVLTAAEGKCQEIYELFLRGEKTIVCKNDSSKIEEVKKMLSYFISLKSSN